LADGDTDVWVEAAYSLLVRYHDDLGVSMSSLVVGFLSNAKSLLQVFFSTLKLPVIRIEPLASKKPTTAYQKMMEGGGSVNS
jgi:hypothetical protein